MIGVLILLGIAKVRVRMIQIAQVFTDFSSRHRSSPYHYRLATNLPLAMFFSLRQILI